MTKKKAARASAGTAYGHLQPFCEKDDGKGPKVVDDPEATEEGQAEKPRETPEMRAPEGVKAITAQLQQIATEAGKGSERAIEAIDEVKSLIEASRKEYAKFRPAPKGGDSTGIRATIDDVVAGKTNLGIEARVSELNDRAIARQIMRGNFQLRKDPRTNEQVTVLPKDTASWSSIPEYNEIRLVAGDLWETTTSNDGAEWAPTVVSSMGVGFYTVRGDLLAALRTVTIPQGVKQWDIPVITSQTSPSIVSEQTDANANLIDTSNFAMGATAVASLKPKKHLQIQGVSVEGTEDMAVDALMLIRQELNSIMVGAIEEAVINGQAASDTDLDDAPATSGLNSADGYSDDSGDNSFRLHCVINSFTTGIAGTLDAADVLAMRESMSKFGARPRECALVCSPKAYLGLLQDKDGVLTVEKYGSRATVLTGELGSVGGVPILVSDRFPETLDSNGINAGAGSTTTGAVLFNRTRWTLGVARDIRQTMIPQPAFDIVNIVASVRSHFVITATDEHSAHYAINIT